MTRLKKIIISGLAVALLSLGGLMGAHAMQHRGGEHRDPSKMIEHMQKKLGLSDQQVTQIKDIYAKNEATLKADHDAIKAAANEDAKKAAFQKMRADMEAVQAQVKPILTADQLAKLNEFKQKHEGREGKGHGQWKGQAPQNQNQLRPQN
jgi:Spy/CpxP family protein refolding chaperone